jgi:hypothetical protein
MSRRNPQQLAGVLLNAPASVALKARAEATQNR